MGTMGGGGGGGGGGRGGAKRKTSLIPTPQKRVPYSGMAHCLNAKKMLR